MFLRYKSRKNIISKLEQQTIHGFPCDKIEFFNVFQ